MEIKLDIKKLAGQSAELDTLLDITNEYDASKINAGSGTMTGAGMAATPIIVVVGSLIASAIGYIYGKLSSANRQSELEGQYTELISRQNIIIDEQARTTKQLQEAIERLQTDKDAAEKELKELQEKLDKCNTLIKRINDFRAKVEK